MLSNLVKHELRSTQRIFLPLFGVVLALSLCVSLFVNTNISDSNVVLSTLFGIISFSYGLGLFSLFVVILVLMIQRFRTNLLGDEGYVMFTLPVSTHHLILSKFFVSLLWLICAIGVVCLSGLIVTFDMNFFQELVHIIQYGWQELTSVYGINAPIFLTELVFLFLLGYLAICLEFYASMSIGHSFDRRKMLYSVLIFFGIQFLLNFLSSFLMSSDFFPSLFGVLEINDFADIPPQIIYKILGFFNVINLLYCSLFYFCTHYFLNKRLNLE